jgi:hypothetical protein
MTSANVVMDLEARAHSEHPEALRLWLRLLTCTQLVEKQAPRCRASTSWLSWNARPTG